MRTHLAALVALTLTLAATPAFACAFFEGFWNLNAPDELATPADGPLVVMLIGQEGTGGLPSIGIESFTELALMTGENAVAGEGRIEDTVRTDAKRLVFQPDRPLDPELDYTLIANFSVASEFGGGSGGEYVIPVTLVDADDSVPVVTQFDGSETKVGGDRVCCPLGENGCIDQKNCGGGSFTCEACWFERWAYPVQAGLQWEMPSAAAYDYDIVRLDDGSEEVVATTVFDYQLSGFVTFDENWTGERCVRVDATHFETGDVLVGEVRCLSDFGTVDRDPEPPPVATNAGECVSEAVDDDGEPATEQPVDENGDPIGAKGTASGCCSTVKPSSNATALLFLLVALAFARRRR